MKKRHCGRQFLASLFCLLAAASGSAVASSQMVAFPWSADRPLLWGDFQGRPPLQAHDMVEAAQIHMEIRWQLRLTMEYDCQRQLWTATVDRSSLTVSNSMLHASSWVDRTRQNGATLNHEQGHFDLNEVYRRKLRAALAPLTAEGESADAAKRALQAVIEAVSQQILSCLESTQGTYDQQTGHGTDLQAQAEWNARIKAWLASPDQAP